MSGERDLGRLIINVLFLWGGKGRAAFRTIHMDGEGFYAMGRRQSWVCRVKAYN
jgi:hypothetical protein